MRCSFHLNALDSVEVEMNVLMKIKHPNVLGLLRVCLNTEGECHNIYCSSVNLATTYIY